MSCSFVDGKLFPTMTRGSTGHWKYDSLIEPSTVDSVEELTDGAVLVGHRTMTSAVAIGQRTMAGVVDDDFR